MSNFLNHNEKKIGQDFLQNGYIIRPVANKHSLDYIQNKFTKSSSDYLNINKVSNNLSLLNNIHKIIEKNTLNDFRLAMINSSNIDKNFRKHYYNIAKEYLDIIVGNELAMQIRVNLSIQLPEDNSSLLPVHADTWSGDSPFEVVVWVPLVDCYNTKTMFILPPKKAKKLNQKFFEKVGDNSKTLFENIKDDLIWLKVNYGDVLIFNQSLPHGNVVNIENETRWSLNCRFKSIFSPYSDKKLGEFFEPITLKPASQIGMDYSLPQLEK